MTSTAPERLVDIPPAGTRARTLVADLDSLTQAEWVIDAEVGIEEAWFRFRAALRLSHLVAEEIVLTDAQLLDGIYFLALGPDGIAEVLGLSRDAPLPLVVIARAPDLAAALHCMETAPGFDWSSTRAARARADQLGLTETELRVARRGWVAAARAGRIVVEPFGRDFPMAATLAEASPPAGVPAELVRDLRGTVHRSTALRVIDEASVAEEVRQDAQRWWTDAYAAALARQHAATWLTFEDPADALAPSPATSNPLRRAQRLVRAIGQIRRRRRRAADPGVTQVALDGSILTTMGEVPPGLYATIAYRTQEVRRTWLEAKDTRALLSLALAVRTGTTPAEPWSRRYFWTWTRVVVMVATAVVTVALAFFPWVGGWIVTPIVIALLSEVPYAEMKALVEDRPGRLRGVLHLPGSGPA